MRYFEDKLAEQLDKKTLNSLSNFDNFDEDFTSIDYEQFRIEMLPTSISLYEKLCYYSEKLLNVAPDKKTEKEIEEEIFKSHLNITPKGVMSFTILFSIIFLMFGLILIIFGKGIIGFGIILIALFGYMILQKLPVFFAKKFRAKANDEVIIAIFYIVAYMRFSSNFERAVNFAANYLSGPLSLDFKRILWDVENAKYSNIEKAFEVYLESWRDENLEFLEAIYLIESSLYESEEFRRISLLDKSLDIILSGNYEKMLHFAQDLRSSVSTFNMMGVVLPILGLIILPLAASFGNPKSVLSVVILLYDILIPFGIAYFAFKIVSSRPSSVNSVKPPKNLKNLSRLQMVPIKFLGGEYYLSPKIPALIIFILFLFIGLTPIIFHITGYDQVLNNILSQTFGSNSPFGVFEEYKEINKGDGYTYGPYGVYPGILSLFITMAFAFSIGYYLKFRYKNLIHLRDRTKDLEKSFPSACFQLGNRINEGISAELAFGEVAETMKGTEAGIFFSKIDSNIKFDNLSVEEAIFDKSKGAINQYPSDLISSSMKILVRAINNGPEITAKTLLDLSRYLTEIHMSNERLLDLLTESLSSMKSQAFFLAPFISAVVISIISLVTMILGILSNAVTGLGGDVEGADVGSFLGNSIPTYLFQPAVGIYIVILIIVLIYVVSNLENGDDEIQTRYLTSQALLKGITKYSIVVTLGILLFSFIGGNLLSGLGA